MFLNQEDQVFWISSHLRLKYRIFIASPHVMGFSFFAGSACLLYAISINQSL